MQTNITKEEALSLLRHARAEPLGLLVYASEAQPFIQALYRAKREDPALQGLQILRTPDGIAICHDPTAPYPEQLAEMLAEDSPEGKPQGDHGNDSTLDTGDAQVPPVPIQE